MRPLPRKQRWALLALGLVASAGVGTALGRAYERHAEAEPAAPAVAEDDEAAVLAEALDLERAPSRHVARAAIPAPPLPVLGKPARTGQAALRARLPLPLGASPLVSMGEQLVANGVPMQLASFETSARAVDVLDFYARHFQSRGWPYSDVPGARRDVPYPALSATLLEEGVQLTVMVIPHEGGTSVVLGQADMDAALAGQGDEDTEDLPAYPDTQPLVVRARSEGLADLTVSFDTPDAPERVEAFYRKSLSEQGYALVADAQEPQWGGLRMLNFAGRQGRRWSLALSVDDGRTAITAHGSHPQERSP